MAVPGWTRPSAMSGRGRTGGVPSAWPQGRRLPVPRLPADSAGGQARSAAMVTHWGPTPPPSAQPAPQTGGKSPHDSGEGRALSRVPAGLRTAEHPPLMGGTEEGVQHTAGHLACGTPGSAQPRVGGRADGGRGRGPPALTRPLTEAAVGPQEPRGAVAGSGDGVAGAPVETSAQLLTARPEAPRRAPCREQAAARAWVPQHRPRHHPPPPPWHRP